jgi:hypothetical protein
MALAQVGKRFKEAFKHSDEQEKLDTPKRQEEEEKLERMRKMKGSVKVRALRS